MPDGLPRVGSALLVRDEANRVLLGKRNKDPMRGYWVIPGGKIRPFEPIAEAAARELREETGLEVEVQSQFRVYEIINAPSEHRIVIYSWGRLIGGTPKASDDLSELAFFAPDELGTVQTSPLVRAVLVDAGLFREVGVELPSSGSQLNFFFFPIVISSGKENISGKLRPSKRIGRPNRSKTPRKLNAPLLFGQ